jgi:hypothetical protein
MVNAVNRGMHVWVSSLLRRPGSCVVGCMNSAAERVNWGNPIPDAARVLVASHRREASSFSDRELLL